jgi:hypothetical protein
MLISILGYCKIIYMNSRIVKRNMYKPKLSNIKKLEAFLNKVNKIDKTNNIDKINDK